LWGNSPNKHFTFINCRAPPAVGQFSKQTFYKLRAYEIQKSNSSIAVRSTLSQVDNNEALI
jgi:hypothetical protein